MRLVERMRHDVQKRQREQRQPALQHHEAHLRAGGPGQRGLHRRLRQRHRRAEQRAEPADQGQHGQHARRREQDVGEADQQETAGIHHARMQQRRDRASAPPSPRSASHGSGTSADLKIAATASSSAASQSGPAPSPGMRRGVDRGDVCRAEARRSGCRPPAPAAPRSRPARSRVFFRAARRARGRSG